MHTAGPNSGIGMFTDADDGKIVAFHFVKGAMAFTSDGELLLSNVLMSR